MNAALPSWLESLHLERAEGGPEARRWLDGLAAQEREGVLEVAERIAEHGLGAARGFLLAAPRVHAEGGIEAVRWWSNPGIELVGGPVENREAATAYFELDAAGILRAGPERLERWMRVVRNVQERSRRLSVAFVEGTGALLGRIDEEVVAACARAGMELHESIRWRGEMLAVTLFRSASRTLPALTPPEVDAWARLGGALHATKRTGAGFFETLPEGIDELEAEERKRILEFCRDGSARDPDAAERLWRGLPGELASFGREERGPLIEAVTASVTELRGAADLLPLLGAIGRALPAVERGALFRRVAHTAKSFPACVPPLLRSLPRAREEVDLPGVERWIAYGESIAESHPEAARAYFALESQTGIHALRENSTAVRIDEVQRTLRGFARMLAGRPVAIEGVGEVRSLRPLLLSDSLEGGSLAFPDPVDAFDSWEENFTLLRLMVVNGIGRLLFGTYDLDIAAVAERLPSPLAERLLETVSGTGLGDLLDVFPPSDALIRLFAACEGTRLDARLRRLYRGFDADLRGLAGRLSREAHRTGVIASPELTLFLLGGGVSLDALPDTGQLLDRDLVELVASLLLSPDAKAEDALAAAVLLRERFGQIAPERDEEGRYSWEELLFEQFVAEHDEEASAAGSGDRERAGANELVEGEPKAVEEDEEGSSGGVPLSAEELRHLLKEGLILKVGRDAAPVESAGIFAQGLDAPSGTDSAETGGETPAVEAGASRRRPEGVQREFEYDEWDHRIGDYRSRWCLLQEVILPGDSGESFQDALSRHRELLPDVRRQFQQIPPERYRRIRGLEDGEDFDLNAVVDARVDLRAGRSPSTRLYVARRREERDVATLFLLDMSASTDEAIPPGEGVSRSEDRRVIDVTRDALVVMAEALEEIGDQYAVFGFSGEGRRNVEFYLVKQFNEGLGATVRSRIGGLEPRRSTRMGPAIRHAIHKLGQIHSRSKHLLLLSDGFPQDFDYGEDRRSNVYGIQDTAKALQECQTAGITPFCITVDKTGHDYLREMCPSSQYLVLEEVSSLPAELPKIYERWVHG